MGESRRRPGPWADRPELPSRALTGVPVAVGLWDSHWDKWDCDK